MSRVKRIYVEKKPLFAVAAKEVLNEIVGYLNIDKVSKVRVLIRYDIEDISEDTYRQSLQGIFSEPPLDILYEECFPYLPGSHIFSVEFLPGQFDQRADSAIQCVKLLNQEDEPLIRSAITYVIEGSLSDEELKKIKNNLINPVDSRETTMDKPRSLVAHFEEPDDVPIVDRFKTMNQEERAALHHSLNLAMSLEDLNHIQNYFISEDRDPTLTEIKVLDTYWSDHCRHTTFSTELRQVKFEDGYYRERMESTYQEYLRDREMIWGQRVDKPACLMDLALMAMRTLKAEGKLENQEESEEINACSIVVPVDVDDQEEEWLISFKNETHNHPTEIEPFGGAATCLGGAIRDPLSGRSYVYQAMRVTGAADPRVPLEDTLKGKLPQKKIVQGAAKGYSSYGNQIGLATGLVKEIYHPDYVAKRMEIGAVIGAAKREQVIRESSAPGDLVILLGGRTGRDGCGGATGSSKVHTEESIESCGAEVQKGNAPTERKIQRLFRRSEVSALIKKCNDFGAGGVSVAIGELADGLKIYLDLVPKKYAGLNGTEIAISESQERMAVVVAPENVDQFLAYAQEENVEAVWVAEVTSEKELVMFWRGQEVVHLSRAFLDTNGAHQVADVYALSPSLEEHYFGGPKKIVNIKHQWLQMASDLNVCSQQGLVEMFDSSIGAGSVLMPYGGLYQLTETQVMVAKVPVREGKTNTVTMMSYGFDPYLSAWSPYHGGAYAVLESIAKIVACGGDYRKIRFTFQEYFKRMTTDPTKWSQPFLALLGAYESQKRFDLASIGGKDSMSGTFKEIDVPPTLVSFAVDTGKVEEIISPELKQPGNLLVLYQAPRDEFQLPSYEEIKSGYLAFYQDIRSGHIVSAFAVTGHGVAEAIMKMAFGNRLGVKLVAKITTEELFAPGFGSIVAEVPADRRNQLTGDYQILGEVTAMDTISCGNINLSLAELEWQWQQPLNEIFPIQKKSESKIDEEMDPQIHTFDNQEVRDWQGSLYICQHKVAKPSVFIPVFPGTNCEYDSVRAFTQAGATVQTKIFKNLTSQDIKDSVAEYLKIIDEAQIIMFPGGFSGGDEPDGSAKFFASAFRNEAIADAVMRLLNERDGLILGICNGFQALIKLGLLPSGSITGQIDRSPTLTHNTIGRHISRMAYTKVVSNKSPWLQMADLGRTYVNPISHGEGRFVANTESLKQLFENGQVALQYTDSLGVVDPAGSCNVNGSIGAIEAITSPDGRVLGKMAHSERIGDGIAKNIVGDQNLNLFTSGVNYFK